jgi:hypothetical protein
MDSSTAQALPGTEEAVRPFWSPESDYLAFFAQDKLKKIGASGGPPQVLCDQPTLVNSGGAWGADDVILFGQGNGPLLRVSASGGRPTPATELDESLCV